MSTVGQFNSKNPTIKRILKEARELSTSPSPDYHAAPLETNLFEWHFTIRGPPAPSPFARGLYHGRIVLPSTYPLRPPSFRFTTPTGRFEVNREICLSISGHHEEMWQPAWGVRTALVAIRSFMETDAKGQLGGLDSTPAVRLRLAEESRGWKCSGCGGKSNEEIMKEREAAYEASGADIKTSEHDKVPEELRLGYRDELGKDEEKPAQASSAETRPTPTTTEPSSTNSKALSDSPPEIPSSTMATASSPAVARPRQSTPQRQTIHRSANHSTPVWLDNVIVGIAIAITMLLLHRFYSIYS